MAHEFLYKKFKEIDIKDEFFNSLKNDYNGFEQWFDKKANEHAYIQTIDDKIEGFLYLKIEEYPIEEVIPEIECERAVKIGTMKINPHGTRLGERFIKKSLDFAIQNGINHIYVTVFEKHSSLINVYKKYGFKKYGTKTTSDGSELVFLKDLSEICSEPKSNYPRINVNSDAYVLSILPKFHTRLFPDSKLNTESMDIVEDVSHTNSIEKIYICRMGGVSDLKKGDSLIIYRTTDIQNQAEYRAVATSICVVEDVKSNRSFAKFEDYKEYCRNYSVFSESELRKLYNDKYEYFTIKMTYNAALSKRITRHDLIVKIGMDRNLYWGFFKVNKKQLEQVLEEGKVNSGYIID